jgi:hypothetical protein
MVALIVGTQSLRRNRTKMPPVEPNFSNEAWGNVLIAGERIEAQVPALQPPAWWKMLNTNFTANRGPTARQLALTSNGALLIAERSSIWGLHDRNRYQLGAITIENLKNDADHDGEQCVSLRLVLPRRKLRLYQVPRRFLDQLRSMGVRVATGG